MDVDLLSHDHGFDLLGVAREEVGVPETFVPLQNLALGDPFGLLTTRRLVNKVQGLLSMVIRNRVSLFG